MKNFRWFAGIFTAIFILTACRQTTVLPVVKTGGESVHALMQNGKERSYILYTPGSRDALKPYPVVFVLHGGGGNAENASRMSNMNEIAKKEVFLVVYANGTGRFDDKLFTWNGGTCCGFSQENNVDDVGFMRAILEDLKTSNSIDANRIYATGMSNGGIMSYRLACEAADIFAAIAPVSGTQNFSPCTPADNVSVLHFHGTDDQHLPYEGGIGSKSLVNVDFASVNESISYWVEFNQCALQPDTKVFEDIRHETWTDCANSVSVELYTIIGGKHAWPGSSGPGWAGGDEPSRTISASQLMWNFFEAHPKP